MAAPCGCGGAAITVEGKAPVEVTRSGARPTIYTVGLNDGWERTIPLGPGLVYDEATDKIQVKLSKDAGNTTRFGTDEGIYSPGEPGPVPAACGQTLADLPDHVVGAKMCACLHFPYSSPFGVDYALANQIDLVHFQVAATADGAGVVADGWDNKITGGHTSIYIGQDILQLSTSTVQSVWNFAGDLDDPVPYQRPNPDTPESRKDRKGGWYGWLSQNYYQPLAMDFMREIDAKAIALLACTPHESAFGSEAVHLQAGIRTVLAACAQNWSLLGVSTIENATTVLNAGCVPILGKEWPTIPDAWGVTELPFPVADVTAAGISWMALSDFYANSVFEAYSAAGIQVLMIGNSRHSQISRIEEVGARGMLCGDPAYYQQGLNGSLTYRVATDPWEHRRMAAGQLTHRTDMQEVLRGVGGGLVRGLPQAQAQGLIIPEGFGEGIGMASILTWESPFTNPETYTMTWDVKWNSLAPTSSGNAKVSVLFGAPTDESTFDWPQDDPVKNPHGLPRGQRSMYRAFQRQNGEIGIALRATDTDSLVYLNRTSTPAMVPGKWSKYTMRVTPTTLTMTRTDIESGQSYSIAAEDATHRGAYAFIEKEESFGDLPATNGFSATVRNFGYAPG